MIYDVIVIGAGPCGLAVAARLRENTPSALFTDAEHARYWRRHSRRANTVEKEARQKRLFKRLQKERNDERENGDEHTIEHDRQQQHDSIGNDNSRTPSTTQLDSPSMLVLDASSEHWMSTWHSRFEALKISHLRSPLFFHCDPRDRDGLLEYSHNQARTDELAEINNVVGREVSKHQKKKGKKRPMTRHLHLDNRDQIDYYTPSTSLFHDYCECLIDRYDLSNLVHKATVTSITYGTTLIPTESSALFTLLTATNQVFLARAVIVAVGPGKAPSIPTDYKFLARGSASHIFDASSTSSLLPAHLQRKKHKIQSIRGAAPAASTASAATTTIAVIGGGLTSAQIVSLLLTQQGINKVHLILRSKLKIKHFDVDLEWVSKLRNANMAAFWSADTDSERFEMLRRARGGGSVPPKWAKLLRKFEKEGKLQCWEETTIVDGVWNELAKTWDLDLDVGRSRDHARQYASDIKTDGSTTSYGNVKQKTSLTGIDHVICATGLAPSINNIAFLAEFANDHPVHSIGGLPQINDDLKWTSEVPLFLTGALAGLRLGPGAGNLAGARLGAERIAWAVEKVLAEKGERRGGNLRVEGRRSSRKSSQADSAYWSGHSSDTNGIDGSGDEDENEDAHTDRGDKIHRGYSVVDRSEFTGGFSNQFEALAF